MIRLNARGVEKPSLPELKEKVRVSLNHCSDSCTVMATFGRQGFQFILYAARVLGVYLCPDHFSGNTAVHGVVICMSCVEASGCDRDRQAIKAPF